MQIEEQNQAVEALEIPPRTDSTLIKKQHGGKRAGSGRKPNLVKRLISGLKAATAAEILQSVDPEKVIKEIFAKGSLTLKQRTLADLWDRAYGRPAQNVNVAGGMVHAHTVWRPLASLSDEEIQLLNKISRKMATPSDSNASQNGSGFQIESSAAIEAEVAPAPIARFGPHQALGRQRLSRKTITWYRNPLRYSEGSGT